MNRAACKDEQETMEGIAATLLCLAVLAEFLCVVPLRLRVLILSLLRPAEAVARGFAIEQIGGHLPCLRPRFADRMVTVAPKLCGSHSASAF